MAFKQEFFFFCTSVRIKIGSLLRANLIKQYYLTSQYYMPNIALILEITIGSLLCANLIKQDYLTSQYYMPNIALILCTTPIP